jgi:hypothetical protein
MRCSRSLAHFGGTYDKFEDSDGVFQVGELSLVLPAGRYGRGI